MSRASTARLPRILVVDDDPLVARIARGLFEEDSYTLLTAATGQEALDLLRAQRPDVIILDHKLPDIDGLSVLAQVRQLNGQLPVIFITARGTSQTAIDAMKQGAFDYLAKPLDLSVLDRQVQLALEARRLMHVPVVIADASAEATEDADVLIGRSPLMAEVYKAIGRAAARDNPVLLLGESGTGKALIGRAIYQNSRRHMGPFRTVKCTDFDPAALEVELFGCQTADGPRIGRFEQSSGGTLLLEEIGHASLLVQGKIFRLINGQPVERAGGTEAFSADVRLLATSSLDLEALVEAGSFRTDLYYLLRSLTIHLPPLRRRREDVPLLVDHFVKRTARISRSQESGPVRVSPEAMQRLVEYSWPGNVNELQSVVQQALIENTGTVLAAGSLLQLLSETGRGSDVPGANAEFHTNWRELVARHVQAESGNLYADALAEMERHVLLLVLESTGFNQAKAARILGITRGSLRKKTRALGLQPEGSLDAAGDDLDDIQPTGQPVS